MSSSADSHSIDSLPDSLVLLILDRIDDVKTLARCGASSRRLRSLSHQVHNIVVKVDSVVSDHLATAPPFKPRASGSLSRLFRHLIFKTLGQCIVPKRDQKKTDRDSNATLHHHSPSRVLRDFLEIKSLRIELPSPELNLGDNKLLKWSASFGTTLSNCVIIAATSISNSEETSASSLSIETITTDDDRVMPESFYASGDLRSRVVWTIGTLISASARHYLVQHIIDEHKTLESLVVSDVGGQGVLRMGRDQIKELRTKSPSVSCSARRTVVPDLEMKMWYANRVELALGAVLVGVTMVAVQPKENMVSNEKFLDDDWISGTFDEPFASVAKVLVKGKTYSVDMNSF